MQANSPVAYAPPGYLLFCRERNLMAQRFDAAKARVEGDPLPVAEQFSTSPQIFDAPVFRFAERPAPVSTPIGVEPRAAHLVRSKR